MTELDTFISKGFKALGSQCLKGLCRYGFHSFSWIHFLPSLVGMALFVEGAIGDNRLLFNHGNPKNELVF